MCWRKKDAIPYMLLFYANVPGIMDTMDAKWRKRLIDFEKKNDPKMCSNCIFYYNVFDDDGLCIGGKCTLDASIDITDRLERVKECPLNDMV